MKHLLLIIFTIFSLVFSSCGSGKLKNNMYLFFNKITGTWKMENRVLYEKWTTGQGSPFNAAVFWVNGQDTVTNEIITILERGDALYYQAFVLGENNGEPVRFKLIEADENRLLFENKNHDFPQLIEYNYINKSSMKAVISGKFQNKERRVEFKYVRLTD